MSVDLGWVDIGLMLFMAVSIIVGLMRGVVFEILSLAGWLVAYLAAQLLTSARGSFRARYGRQGIS